MRKSNLSDEFLNQLSPEEAAFITSWEELYNDEEFKYKLLGLEISAFANKKLFKEININDLERKNESYNTKRVFSTNHVTLHFSKEIRDTKDIIDLIDKAESDRENYNVDKKNARFESISIIGGNIGRSMSGLSALQGAI